MDAHGWRLHSVCIESIRCGDKKKERKRLKIKKETRRNGIKSEGVEMVSAVRRSLIANSRGKVGVVYATGDGH